MDKTYNLEDQVKTKTECKAFKDGCLARVADSEAAFKSEETICRTENPYKDSKSKLYDIWNLGYGDIVV